MRKIRITLALDVDRGPINKDLDDKGLTAWFQQNMELLKDQFNCEFNAGHPDKKNADAHMNGIHVEVLRNE